MKKLLLILLCLPMIGFGQITTTKAAEPPQEIKSFIYDSLSNFLAEDVMQYIGQELYLKGKSESLQKYGYEGFLVNYKIHKTKKNNIYKCCSDKAGYNSNYKQLYGKYFKVIDVIHHPKANEAYYYADKWYFKLEEKEEKDIVYFEYSSEFSSQFNFIVVGHFIKLKEKYIDNQFVLRTSSYSDATNILTGKKISYVTGDIWTCKDVTVEEKYYSLSLLIENDKKEIITIRAKQLDNKYEGYKGFFTLKESLEYQKKFGKEKWHLILDGKVKAGFTEEMVRVSWGKPKSINRSSSGDQWIYEESYLYFDNNGIMTSFN